MKIENVIKKVCALWTFLFFAVPFMQGAKNEANTFATPDFAFPATVSGNARTVLESSLKKGDSGKALQAAIQIVIAENLVSRDNAPRGVALLDSVAGLLPQPYSSLCYLLEGRLYADVYSAESRIFDRRTIPVEPVPDDIREWSRDIFSRKIVALTEKAMEGSQEAQKMGIGEIGGIITDSRDAMSAGLTVYDFMVLQALGNLRRFCNSGNAEIPFGPAKGNRQTEYSASGLSSLLLTENLEWHDSLGLTSSGAIMDAVNAERAMSGGNDTRLRECVKKYEHTPWDAGFIFSLYKNLVYSDGDQALKREAYKVASDYLKAYPDCRGAEALRGMLTNLKAGKINISAMEQCLPGKEIKGRVRFENIDSFYILAIKVNEEALERNITEAALRAGIKASASVRISASDVNLSIPYCKEQAFTLPPLESGVYALIASRTPDSGGMISNPTRNSTVPVMLVSRLSQFTLFGQEKGKSYAEYYITEGTNNSPVAGATVTFTPQWNNRDWKKTVAVTDRDGRVRVPDGSYKVLVKAGKDILYDNVYSNRSFNRTVEVLEGRLLTSLSIYRPGDKMQFAGAVYTKKGQELKSAPDKRLRVILHDANYQERDTLPIVTDRFGRISGEFLIPKEGLAGTWSVALMDGENHVGQSYFNVEEYKSPTFYLTLSGTEGEVKIGEVVRIKGEVRSYSGMPVADAEVKFDVSYTPWFLYTRYPSGNANYGGTVKSGTDGTFLIELPTAALKDTPYAIGRYRLNVTATDAAGETQTAPALSFQLGEAYSISADMPEKMEVGGNVDNEVKVSVFDMLGKPVRKHVYYRIETATDSLEVASGEFESGRFPFDFSTLKSGKYNILFSVSPELKNSPENGDYLQEVVLWRKNDLRPPYETPLWVEENEIVVPYAATGSVKVRVGGSCPDGLLFAEVADMDGTVDRRWVRVADNIVEIPVKRPGDMERVRLNLTGTYNLESKGESVTIIPEIQTKGLEIKTETFRDLLTPGANEEWKFLFTFSDCRMSGLPVMAVLSNKALNALSPFSWAFNPYGSIYWRVPGNIDVDIIRQQFWNYEPSRPVAMNYAPFVRPEWNTYGEGLYGVTTEGMAVYNLNSIRIRGGMMMKSASSASKRESAIVDTVKDEVKMAGSDMAFEEVELEEAAVVTAGGADGLNGGKDDSETSLREVECPLAFFMPDLTTDNDGIATLDFVVPEFNGTWQLQLMGYTEDMRGAVMKKDAVSSKPVMAQMNVPRFARTGDLLSVSCTVYNNTTDSASLGGRIVFFNPLTDEVYESSDFAPERVEAMGSRVISRNLRIPTEINMLGIRVYGEGISARDGEQTVVPVYPSSTPVVESTSFLFPPGETNLKMKIPAANQNGLTTLSYTDNPVWECLTALPAIMDADTDNVLARSAMLYATAVADGLLKSHPSLAEAVRLFSDPAMSGDSTLVSNLEKNPRLKTVALVNTPWVRSAQSETLRMQSLIDYLDTYKAGKSIKETVSKLAMLQQGDGGWSWCPGMESSVWVTTGVLDDYAMLRRAGYLPSGCRPQAKKAFSYVEKDIVKEWKKIGSSNYSYTSLLDFLYTRSIYGYSGGSSDFNRIKARALDEIEKEWKSMEIYSKATAALVLYREGRKAVAGHILESLRQYASVSKEKGMWFDNLSSGYSGKGKLLTTARVLEAWQEIAPSDSSIDLLRQWLLLSKQVEDWGGGHAAANFVHAVLTTGSEWTGHASAPSIYIDGEKVEIGKIARLTGALTLPLSGKKGSLEIERDATGPAWGGIISQYVAPIKDVKSTGTAGFSVEKNLYVITNDADGTTASAVDLKTGDRVRVTLTIKSDRDLQYVAVTDSRATCLEPADKLSGYTSSDGVWMYKEIRNNAVNLFIPHLTKGTHVISYDCFVDRSGDYASGIATAQSQYAPVITAHSAGEIIRVEGK